MSTTNAISVTIPDNIIADSLNNVRNIINNLQPYLQSLTEEQRHDLFKMGDKSVGYITKVAGYVDTHPQFVPAYMDVAEFKKDVDLVNALQPVYAVLSTLFSDVSDTRMLAGSEAIVSAKMYYGSVHNAAIANVVGSKPIYEDLNARFPGRKGNSGGGTTPTADTNK